MRETQTTTTRHYCASCRRPCRTCLCKLVLTVPTATELIIWQHPAECDHPKGSGRLLHLCLPNSRLVVGEKMSAQSLEIEAEHCGLLYPVGAEAPAPARPAQMRQLLLLDATWRKSRRMLYVNPWLQQLPRVVLVGRSSAYRIRKAEKNDQLSTFEAALAGLQMLEPEAGLASLQPVFSDFVQHLQRFRPS